jgi:hypothetical protein
VEAIFFELERFKNERSWYNLNLPRESIRELLSSPDWYQLLIPKEELDFTNFGKVRLWQEIATVLLKKYCDRYYKYRKNEYEMPHFELRELSAEDPNFFECYRLLVDESREDIIEALRQLKGAVERGELRDVDLANLEGENDPKISFYSSVKDLERRLGDKGVRLHPFILSNTPYEQVRWWGRGMTLADFESSHVLFTDPDGSVYIGKMVNEILGHE